MFLRDEFTTQRDSAKGYQLLSRHVRLPGGSGRVDHHRQRATRQQTSTNPDGAVISQGFAVLNQKQA
jgi:hypothetical protein